MISGFDPEKSSYNTIANALKKFQDFESLPNLLKKRCQKYACSNDLLNAFLKQKAVFHKNCITNYNSQKLSRVKRKLFCEDATLTDTKDSNDVVEHKRPKRSSVLGSENLKRCFFCNDSSDGENMHRCMTLELNEKIKEIAQETCNAEVLAKLSVEEMVASRADYHLKCLAKFYNHYRSFKSSEKVIEDSMIEGIYTERHKSVHTEFV